MGTLRKTGLAVALAFAGPTCGAVADILPDAVAFAVPSGQPVRFFEAIMDRPGQGLVARFRFVAPDLAVRITAMDYSDLEADLAHLCNTYALPRLGTPEPNQIVISLSEVETPFGDTDPNVTQVFEAYQPAGDHCEWEAF